MGTRPKLTLGNYETLLELASGGMGTVYVARQLGAGGFERLVVVKHVHPHLLKSREFCDMFRDEARLASQIRHPNVVSVDDVVEADGELFLVQPYVESITFAELIEVANERGEQLPAPVVARILADALAGLQGAHDAVDMRGERLFVVHRDVSPQNILVGTDGRSRLIDFGIAKAARRSTVTGTGILKGKLSYMAPEQFRHQELDARTDVFSAGVVLYEGLTGKRPFEGADEGDTLLAILVGDPPPPSTVAGSVPPAVDAVVDRALSRDRSERWSSAAEFHDELEKAISPAPARDVTQCVQRYAGDTLATRRTLVNKHLDATGATSEGAAPPVREASSSSKADYTIVNGTREGPPDAGRRKTVLVVGGLAFAAGAALVIAFATRGPERSGSPATSTSGANGSALHAQSVAPAAASAASPAEVEVPSAPETAPASSSASPRIAPPRKGGQRAPSKPKPTNAELQTNPYGSSP